MARLAWLAALSATAAIAILVAFRGQAAAQDGATCTRIDGYLSFCLNVPATGARRETTIPLVSLPTARADVRVETTVPGSDAAALTADVDRSVERVEALFRHAFDPRPRVLLFGTSASFATATRELFGYSAENSAYVASTYGGIFDRGTMTIALNWSSAGSSRMSAAIEHELSHLMIREVTGNAEIPAWLDEGIATAIEQDAAANAPWTQDDVLAGRAVAQTGLVSLAELESVSDFHSAYARIGRPLYGYVAEAVRGLEARIGWDGVLDLLRAANAGAHIDAAYYARAGESLAAVEARLGRRGPEIAVSSFDDSGNVRWTLLSGTPGADMMVRIDGGPGYRVTFTVRTDALGMYRGSFGSTAAPGLYTVRAAGAEATFSTGR
ncbi:MAG TPA: hypothetical protein VFC31_09295 [Candidatus Limnocylindria bacterium]|nr:hypothetical protein [Candidatus Limnocylindria bacterium]